MKNKNLEIVIEEITFTNQKILELLLLADPSKKNIDEYTARGKMFVAYHSEEIVGVYVLIKTRPGTMEIVNIAIDEEYQGKGFGRRLLKDAILKATEHGAKVLEIGTGNSSLGQLGLYQKMGFRITGVDQDYFLKHYDQPIYENGIRCIDMIRLSMDVESANND